MPAVGRGGHGRECTRRRRARPLSASATTAPAGPLQCPVSGIHDRARLGFGRAGTVAAYERGRPGYPADAVAELVRVLGVAPGATVLDLAAGTGKLTRQLMATGAT